MSKLAKGCIGEAEVQLDMLKKGYTIFTSSDKDLPFDFVAYKRGRFIRVQVKYVSAKSNSIAICIRSTSPSLYKDGFNRPAKKSEIEIVGVYCPQNDQCYYFDPKKIKGDRLTLRLKETSANNQYGTHLAEDYLEIPNV